MAMNNVNYFKFKGKVKMKKVTVDQWKEVFVETGLSDDDMQKWHHVFEKKYPEGHQSFLEWLDIEPSRIKEIRRGNK